MAVAQTFQSTEEQRQSFVDRRPNYITGQKVLPNDHVWHVGTDRKGIMHGIRPGGRILVRWIDADGNRPRRSTVDLDKLRLLERDENWKEEAA